jgi:Tfp pilus assembly protein PilF
MPVTASMSDARAAVNVNGKSNRRLVGWKAIGQFLGCTERTARRWESRTLPVHRVPGGSRSSVWADPDELTTWLLALPSKARADLRAEASAPPPEPAVLPEPAPQPAPAATTRRGRSLRLSAAIVLGALAVLGMTIYELAARRPGAAAAVAHTQYDDNPEARETYLTARFELSMRSMDSLTAAEKSFRQLVDRYPERAAGWAGLADTYLMLREFGSMPDEVAYPRAAHAASAALALEPRLADAWLDQAFVAWWWQGDSAAAFPAFRNALRLEPNSAKAMHWYATALYSHGDYQKSLQTIARARALDPGNRAMAADEAWIRFGIGQRNEALATLERMAQLDPNFVSWRFYLAHAYLVLSRDQDFLREALAAAELRGQSDAVASLRLAAQRFEDGGRPAMLEQLSAAEAEACERGSGSAVVVAEYRALAGDRAGMLKWLALAEARHDHNLPALRGYPEFSAYRNDPAFGEVLARLP